MGLGNRGVGNKVAVVRVLIAPLEALQTARGMLFPWIAVLVGCGIGVWFLMPDEPGLGSYTLAASLVRTYSSTSTPK